MNTSNWLPLLLTASYRRPVGYCLRLWVGLASLLAGSWMQPAAAQEAARPTRLLRVAALDSVVAATLAACRVPGLAVAVVQAGQVVLTKGYGVRSLATGARVDENTLFGIASNTKAFTAAALGLLVDEGKLRWDDPVIRHLPEFQLRDSCATAQCTVRDLLSHRSGLGLGAGELLFFPDSTDYTAAELLRSLRYLPLAAALRSKFIYSNMGYTVAGQVVARVSGQSWEEFVERRLLRPLGMARSAAHFDRLLDPTNVSAPHTAGPDGQVRVVRRARSVLDAPAGALYASATDLGRWVQWLLGDPSVPALLQSATHRELWTAQTIINGYPAPGRYRTHYVAYGLGWLLRDVLGYQEVSHAGDDVGMISQVTLLPELGLGIVVLANGEQGDVPSLITSYLRDYYLGLPSPDRLAELRRHGPPATADTDSTALAARQQVARARQARPQPNPAPYLGNYRDAWLGEVRVYAEHHRLWLQAQRSPRLRGELLPYQGSTYVLRWCERSFQADAFATFGRDGQGAASTLKLKAISPLTTFNFDFQDLNLRRVP